MRMIATSAAGRALLRAGALGGFGGAGLRLSVGRRFSPRPIPLDLDGNGIRIAEQSRSGVFVDAGGDGLLHRTAWAGAGDGVLFYDPDGTPPVNSVALLGADARFRKSRVVIGGGITEADQIFKRKPY